MKAAIIGGGTAGAAAALFLARDGHAVTLFERVADPQPVGAGLLLQPTGMDVMADLGLLDAILAKGARIGELYGTIPGGRAVIDIAYEKWRGGAFGLGLHRGVLFDALWQPLRAAGVDVHCGVEVDAFTTSADGVRLHTTDDGRSGSGYDGSNGGGEYDLLVLADGTRSALRAQTGIKHRATPYPWGALWAILPDPYEEYKGVLRQWYRGAHQMLGVMPTGAAPQNNAPVVSLFWSLRADRLDTWRAAGLAEWKKEAAALVPEVRGLLARISDPAQLTYASYADVVMPRWHTGRVVVIGDAAHAMSPQLGQGANLALIDAQVLAASLRHPIDDSTGRKPRLPLTGIHGARADALHRTANPAALGAAAVPVALERYTRQRRSHLSYYQFASRWLTPAFQSDGRIVPALRDIFTGPMCKLPFTSGQMLDTLVGVKTGLLFGRIATP